MNAAARIVVHVSSVSSWDILAAVATATAAFVTLATIIATIIITRQERAIARKALTDERAIAAEEATERRRQHAEQIARMDADHEAERERFAEERRRFVDELAANRWREQLADAQAITVILHRDMHDDQRPDEPYYLIAYVWNQSRSLITDVRAKFTPSGQGFQEASRTLRWPNTPALPSGLRGGRPLEPVPGSLYRLPVGDVGWLQSDTYAREFLTDPAVVVRWNDRSGTRWEYDRGDLHEAPNTEPRW